MSAMISSVGNAVVVLSWLCVCIGASTPAPAAVNGTMIGQLTVDLDLSGDQLPFTPMEVASSVSQWVREALNLPGTIWVFRAGFGTSVLDECTASPSCEGVVHADIVFDSVLVTLRRSRRAADVFLNASQAVLALANDAKSFPPGSFWPSNESAGDDRNWKILRVTIGYRAAHVPERLVGATSSLVSTLMRILTAASAGIAALLVAVQVFLHWRFKKSTLYDALVSHKKERTFF